MDKQELFIQMALKAWDTHISKTTKYFDSISDEDMQNEIAPGKNRIVYLLGHLIAVNDGMIAFYDKGDRQYAHLDDAYVNNPDKVVSDVTSVSTLRAAWKQSNEKLSSIFASMSTADWFSRHTAMTDEDHQKEPWRNKLNVLLNRTNHVAYHLGQLVLA
ncbi:MAG: DinB family protein [Chitinophagaceae bacterium]|nr:DinB family protein [Chitinophagaceae bacterium]